MDEEGKVHQLNIETTVEIPADKILKAALGEFDDLIIIGYTKGGAEDDVDIRSTTPDGEVMVTMLERAKFKLLHDEAMRRFMNDG